ncbi:MAG: Crp/Fnr family transcriptional regulator [Terriglobales bacterium]|jgi:CRP-like cAMP-binding protein|nr:cyclic nucleotide-binding domain-containing protein [Terriglobales bacterium]
MEQNTSLPKDQLMSVLRTAPDRLEYLTPNDWILIIDKSRRLNLKKDEVLIKQGKREQTIYILLEGRLRISVSGTPVATVGPGEICGEMAYLENSLASATATVEEEGQAYAIDWAMITDLFELFPHLAYRFYRSLAVKLSRRLREQLLSR